MVFPLLIIFYIAWQRFQANRFVSGLCPLGRMYCIGAYRRNVLNLKQTFLLIIANCCCRVSGNILAMLTSHLSPKAFFWAWNCTAFLWGEAFYLVLPFLLSLPDPGSTLVFSHFYVRKPGLLQPRRQVVTAEPGSGLMTADPGSGLVTADLGSGLMTASGSGLISVRGFPGAASLAQGNNKVVILGDLRCKGILGRDLPEVSN